VSSEIDLRNVSENVGAKILNNLNSVKYMLKACLPLNYIPTKKFTDLLAKKRSGGHLFNKTVAI